MLQSRKLGISKAIGVASSVKRGELRDVDHKEFMDCVGETPDVMNNYGTVLAGALGLMDLRAENFYWSRFDSPVFLATCRVSTYESDAAVLCGVGWKSADEAVSLRDRIQILKGTVDNLILGTTFKKYICYVHEDNRETLREWQLISKFYADKLDVEFDRHAIKYYFLVTICKR